MKRILFVFWAVCLSLSVLSSENSKVINVSFKIEDFIINVNSNNALEISSSNLCSTYSSNYSEPGLPMISVNVLIPDGFAYQDMTVSMKQMTYKENVVLANVPQVITTNDTTKLESDIPSYPLEYYPKSTVIYNGTNDIQGHNIASFLIAPFQYDADAKTLFFSDKFTLNIALKTVDKSSKLRDLGGMPSSIIKSLVTNSEDFQENSIQTYSPYNDESLDYVVITSEELADAFKPLVEWKTTKGVKAEIVTVEYIKEHYINKTVPMQIKDCLYDLYRNRGLKYVLLGGDESVVPVLGCKGFFFNDFRKYEDKAIPTDLYYATFSSYNWDLNQNGIYGEVEDKINFTPRLIVTRVPARTINDVHNFDIKVLHYEKQPTINGWENKMLMSGAIFHNKGDVAAKGEIMFSKYIQPYWNGKRVKFYDTETDMPEGEKYDFSAKNLQEQLSLGYNFVDIMTHGAPPVFSMEKSGFYYCEDAKNLSNNRLYTIITTTACDTNAFDGLSPVEQIDPCLSESFIRSARSGVVAYLGASRYGFDNMNFSLGASPKYNAQFYKYLFSSELKDKHFGEVVAAAKMSMISFCSSYTPERWIQLSLNPIGDPEMPIFTETPRTFDNVTIKQDRTNLIIDTGVDSCRICVMDTDGKEYYSVFRDVNKAKFTSLPKHVSVCITKQNYIPKVYNLTIIATRYVQNESFVFNTTIDADKVIIGSNVTTIKPEGKVVFAGGKILIRANSVTMDSETIIKENADFTITNKKY